MNQFAILADPVRRRIVELLADRELSAGELGAVVMPEFGIGQPAVSNQLKILRDNAVVAVDSRGSQRIYRLQPHGLDEVGDWMTRYSQLWPHRLDALATELARERHQTKRPTNKTSNTAEHTNERKTS